MSALPFGTYISPGRPLFESGGEPMSVKSLVGVSSINSTVYPPVQVLPEYLPAVEINIITGLSTINGSSYPPLAPPVSTLAVSSITGVSSINGSAYPPAASGPRVLSGVIALTTNGQTFTYSTPFTSNVAVVVQGTANAAGVNGFFTVATYGSLSTFRVFYSGALDYGAIQLFFIAAGT